MAPTRKRAPARRSTGRGRSRAPRSSYLRSRRRGAPGGLFGLEDLLAGLRRPFPVLDQRARDVLGLALAALAIFMGFVLWGGWNGGRAGHGLAVGLGWLLGRARVLTPPAMFAGGAALLLRPVLPALRPLRAGMLCLFASITLALAAGTFGLASHGHSARPWSSAHLQSHGGLAGETLYQLADRLIQSVGVDILEIFLLIVAITLLTGASVASFIRAFGSGVRDTTRLARSISERRTGAGLPEDLDQAAFDRHTPDGLRPPEPPASELIVRATHVEAPSQDELEEPDPLAQLEPLEQDADEPPEEEGAFAGEEDPGGEDDEVSGLARVELATTPQGRLRDAVTEDPGFVWELPNSERLLTRSTGEQSRPDTAGQEQTANRLVEALGHFGVQAKVIGTVAGPHITRYELRLAPGTKVAKVAQLKDDLAYALAATDIRILAPIPGKQAVGVEVPNAKRRIVRLGDVFQEPPKDWSPLTVWLGKDVAGKAIGADLAKMPHLLVAGTTGAGKSGAINAMLSSVLLRATPHQVRLVLVDPKQVELNHYESIPHLLTPVITSPRMAANALQNLVKEMEQRYGIMSMARARGLIELNRSRAKRGEAPLPYILCVIDELADLMMVAPADVEDSIIRLAQKARAVGIHLVLATQSPRVDVITGMIKANVPSRIAFSVSSQTDSRVILDQNGAESLLGQGDMLFSPVGTSRLQRIQGAYIDEAQIARLTDLWRRQGEPELREELLEEVEPEARDGDGEELDPDEDPMLRDAIILVAEMQTASTSMLQRRLRLGYTRAGRVIDMLERRGVISGYEGSKPRQVLITEADLPRVLAALGEPTGAASD